MDLWGGGLRNWIRPSHRGCIVLADHSELYSAVASDPFRKVWYRLLEWGYCFAFDGHICASRYLERFYSNRLRRLRKADRVHYSPYAFHPDVIGEVSEGCPLLERFRGKKVILYMGSFWENYGFWDMMRAFRKVSETRADFVAVFVGRGPEEERGIAWVREHGLEDSIVIEGYVAEEHLSQYFMIADGFLSPLRDTVQDWARCPSKLFMYLPFGKPIVTCAIGEAKEIFGSTGLYYSPGSVEELSSRIITVLDGEGQDCAVNPDKHTYAFRTNAFLEWYEHTYERP